MLQRLRSAGLYVRLLSFRPTLRDFIIKCEKSALRVRDLIYDPNYGFADKGSIFINQITGYEECNKLRQDVIHADALYRKLQQELRTARDTFQDAVRARHRCQKELNALLQRKPSWQDEDLLRFTELYRQEMRLEQAEIDAKTLNSSAEKQVDDAHQALMDTLRERYQQEQLWSDKIRRLSTFGTFSLVGLNVLLFLMVQFYTEPKKREKFARSLEKIVETKSDEMVQRVSSCISDEVAKIKLRPSANGLDFSRNRHQSNAYLESFHGAIAGAGVATAFLLASHYFFKSVGIL